MEAVPLRIGIFDDHPLITNGLRALLATLPQYELVVCENQSTDLLDRLKSTTVDVLVLDIVAPNVEGLDLFKTIRKTYPKLSIVAHSSLTSTVLVDNLLQMGVQGYVSKRQPPETLFKALESVCRNEIYVPEQYQFLVQQSTVNQATETLTNREKQILQLIAKGLLSKEIAEQLFISANTVENHRANLFRKFQVKNVAELLRQAMRLGYLAD
ncbi:MAG: LuxR C-terminal-related transcriptional regulator [Salibacteraceae bacterium]